MTHTLHNVLDNVCFCTTSDAYLFDYKLLEHKDSDHPDLWHWLKDPSGQKPIIKTDINN